MIKVFNLMILICLSHSQDIQQKLKKYGIPPQIRTGFDMGQGMDVEPSGEDLNLETTNLLELADKHDITVTATPEELAVEQVKHLVPEHVYLHIPANYILMAHLAPQDSPYFQAFKLEKLGLIIKDIPDQFLSTPALNLRKVLMAHCFLTAGSKLEKSLDQQVVATQNIAPELLMDGYMSAGQFYYWAAVNMPENSRNLVMGFARRSFDKTTQAMAMIPRGHYGWDVIGEKSLSEVIEINSAKIQHYLEA